MPGNAIVRLCLSSLGFCANSGADFIPLYITAVKKGFDIYSHNFADTRSDATQSKTSPSTMRPDKQLRPCNKRDQSTMPHKTWITPPS